MLRNTKIINKGGVIVTVKLTLKAARVNAGLTQKQLASLMGISETTMIKWEKSNGKDIKLGEFKKLCKILKVDTNQLIFLNN
jgi:cro-like protein, phage associated